MPAVNPEILVWARETAGLSLDEAAHAVGLRDSHQKTGAEKLAAFEAGEAIPTRSQLLKMSEKYRRSLVIFYLDKPPKKGDRGEDFRTLPGEISASYAANLDILIREIKARQNLVKSLLEEDEDTKPLSFIGSARMEQGFEAVAQSIVSTLGFSLRDFRDQRTIQEAFAYLRKLAENRSIFILLIGNLGSYHTTFPVEAFRGFAIADPIAPFVVVNDQDATMAWSFTALHEIAHLWLGTTGVSGLSFDLDIERFCNNVAGSILLPSQELNELRAIQAATFDEKVSQVSAFAEARNVSRAMVAYKLLLDGKIEESTWQKLNAKFNRERLELKEHRRNIRGTGGPNYYVVRRHRLGAAILGLVHRAISEGTLSPTKAGKILGVKPGNVAPLLSDLQPRRDS